MTTANRKTINITNEYYKFKIWLQHFKKKILSEQSSKDWSKSRW